MRLSCPTLSLSCARLSSLALASRPPPPPRRSLRVPRRSARRPEWLAAHLHDPDLVLLHVGDKASTIKAHIPGARFVAMSDVSVSTMDHETPG